jgi:hypothetical protein
MFDFIVSGYIPGTHLQVTLSWVLFLVALGLVIYEATRILKRHQMTLHFNVANSLLKSALPLKTVRRKKTESKQLELL